MGILGSRFIAEVAKNLNPRRDAGDVLAAYPAADKAFRRIPEGPAARLRL